MSYLEVLLAEAWAWEDWLFAWDMQHDLAELNKLNLQYGMKQPWPKAKELKNGTH